MKYTGQFYIGSSRLTNRSLDLGEYGKKCPPNKYTIPALKVINLDERSIYRCKCGFSKMIFRFQNNKKINNNLMEAVYIYEDTE